jgi:hypothetical protein
MIKHIKGDDNKTADWLSRLFIPGDQESALRAIWCNEDDTVSAEQIENWADTIRLCQMNEHLKDPDQPVYHKCRTMKTVRKRKQTRRDKEEDDDDDTLSEQDEAEEEADPEVAMERELAYLDEHGLEWYPLRDQHPQIVKLSDEDMIKAVHVARRGHMGVQRTWARLNDDYEGHKIPYKFVEEFIARCGVCQKFRLERKNLYYEPQTRALHAPHLHAAIGIDHIEMNDTPSGLKYMLVVVCHFSKLVKLYPVNSVDADTTAKALLQFYSSYGVYDILRADQGGAFESNVIRKLHEYLGVPIKYSLVRRHESSGVERTNKEIRRHVQILLAVEKKGHNWADPTVTSLVEYLLNSEVNSETGQVPFKLHFGSAAAVYHRLSPTLRPDNAADTATFVTNLDEHLHELRKASKKHLEKVQAERMLLNSANQGQWQPGDLVLFHTNDYERAKDKNTMAKFEGPYEVIVQSHNDVTCEHVVTHKVKDIHVSRLKLFDGTPLEAYELAKYDDQQVEVISVAGHKGKPDLARTDMEFQLNWEDGTTTWELWTRDGNLRTNTKVMKYCARIPHLVELTKAGAGELDAYKRLLRDEPIQADIASGDTVYVNVRCLTGQAEDDEGVIRETDWYKNDFTAPDRFNQDYFYVGKVKTSKSRLANWEWHCPDLHKTGESWKLPNTFFKKWATLTLPDGAIVVDNTLTRQYPELTIKKLKPTQAAATTTANPDTIGGRGVGGRRN